MAATRNLPDLPRSILDGLVLAVNEQNAALAAQGLLPHHEATDLIVGADAAALAGALALANEMKTAYNAHIASTDAHAAADATNPTAAPTATNQGTTNTLLNELKADFNAHIALVASHRGIIGAGVATQLTVATTDASDEGTSVTLANALKNAMNRHFGAGAKLVALVSS